MIDASARRLLVFREVVDLGGFNAAATRLGIAQPSVGAHINALEAQVGQSLLVRHRGARPQLTEAGRIVYELATEVVRLNEAAGLRLANLKATRDKDTRSLSEKARGHIVDAIDCVTACAATLNGLIADEDPVAIAALSNAIAGAELAIALST